MFRLDLQIGCFNLRFHHFRQFSTRQEFKQNKNWESYMTKDIKFYKQLSIIKSDYPAKAIARAWLVGVIIKLYTKDKITPLCLFELSKKGLSWDSSLLRLDFFRSK